MKQFCVYVLASAKIGTLYIGVTSNLSQRLDQHRNDQVDGFTKKYQVHRLVYYEMCDTAEQAITREKQLKSWNRAWKMTLIKDFNPTWKDLANDL
jgi:putative endonuclease